jgi:hypothetical protein
MFNFSLVVSLSKAMTLPNYFSRDMSIGMRNPVVLIVVQLLNQEKKNFAIIVGRTFQNENMTKMSLTAHFQLLYDGDLTKIKLENYLATRVSRASLNIHA